MHWREGVKSDNGILETWFREFDEILGDLSPDVSLDVREDADILYVVNDSDVSFPTDPAPSLGLDTWDF